MRRRSQTFNQILQLAAVPNAQVLAEKARTASQLARIYPESQWFFRAIEDRVIGQLRKIMPSQRFVSLSEGVSCAAD